MPGASVFPILCADLLRAGQRVRFRAWGPSMAPAIRDGDMVTFVPVRSQEIRRGDVVLYTSERGLTAHRVVGRPDGGREIFPAQGDAPGSPRERVPASQVLGRAESVERDGRRVSVRRPFARQVARITWLAGRVLARVGAQERRDPAKELPKAILWRADSRPVEPGRGCNLLSLNDVNRNHGSGTVVARSRTCVGLGARIGSRTEAEWRAETLSREQR